MTNYCDDGIKRPEPGHTTCRNTVAVEGMRCSLHGGPGEPALTGTRCSAVIIDEAPGIGMADLADPWSLVTDFPGRFTSSFADTWDGETNQRIVFGGDDSSRRRLIETLRLNGFEPDPFAPSVDVPAERYGSFVAALMQTEVRRGGWLRFVCAGPRSEDRVRPDDVASVFALRSLAPDAEASDPLIRIDGGSAAIEMLWDALMAEGFVGLNHERSQPVRVREHGKDKFRQIVAAVVNALGGDPLRLRLAEEPERNSLDDAERC